MKEEVLDVVDEEDNFVRKALRTEVRKNALIHKVARIIIRNSKTKFIVYKRSKNADIHPGMWSVGIGETVSSGEDYESAAIRGMNEELGIKNVTLREIKDSFLFNMKYRSKDFNANYKIYRINYDGKIKSQKEEIEEFKWMNVGEVKKLSKLKDFSPSAKILFEKYLQLKK